MFERTVLSSLVNEEDVHDDMNSRCLCFGGWMMGVFSRLISFIAFVLHQEEEQRLRLERFAFNGNKTYNIAARNVTDTNQISRRLKT